LKKIHTIFSNLPIDKIRINREQAHCKLRAQAKINLSLKILGKRPDNYHQLHSIMQTLALHDVIELTLKPSNHAQETSISLFSDNTSLKCKTENIAYRSAKHFLEHFQSKANLEISLVKNIPLAAGLAGGSADGAAVLRGLANLYNNPQSRMFFQPVNSANQNLDQKISQDELLEIAVKIGADVPFCLHRGTALCEGIGEIISPLDSFSERPVLIYNPAEAILTADAFKLINADPLNELKLANQETLNYYNQIIRTGLKSMNKHFFNDFTATILHQYPHLQDVCHAIQQTGSQFVRFTGSGPTIFAIYDSYVERDQALQLLEKSEFPGTFTATYTKDAWD